MKYDSPLAQYNLYMRIPSLRFYDISAARNQRKRECFETSDSAKLDASGMEKNDPTLPTWSSLKIRLFQVRATHRKCVPVVVYFPI